MKQKILKIALTLLAVYLLLEFGTYLLMGYVGIFGDRPTFTWSRIGVNFYQDVPADWATWHQPNSTFRHLRSCFDIEYRFNSEGMRDRPREREGAASRVVVLGDSFIEGWGAEEEARLTNLLERAKGREFLNFGTSGSFGPIQYFLVYDRLAKFFSHDEILVGILPANDFDDDNYGLWVDSGRRRPFWVGEGVDRELRYTEARPTNSAGDRLHRVLKEYSYFYNAAHALQQRWKWRKRNVQAGVHSWFYDFNQEEMERMLFSLQKLRDASSGKKLTLMLIPLFPDADRYAQDGKSPLTTRLETWAAGQDDVVVIDLLPWFQQRGSKIKAYSHRCDNHWNAEGHRAAFELLQRYF